MRTCARALGLALLGSLVAAGASHSQTLRYGMEEGSSHIYTRHQRDHVVQTVEGREQTAEVESFWRFTATVVSSSPGGMTVAIVHDSVAVESTPEIRDGTEFSSLYGKPVTIRMSARGEVDEVSLPDTLSPAARRLDLSAAYRTFYPVLPEGNVEGGDGWADTTRVETAQNGLDLTVVRINRYTVGGRASTEEGEVLEVGFESSLELEGSGSQRGSEVSLSGTGDGTGTVRFDPDSGLYLGGREETEMRMNAFVAGPTRSVLIPIVQTRTETIELVE